VISIAFASSSAHASLFLPRRAPARRALEFADMAIDSLTAWQIAPDEE
jgi:hypothetical protein